ncbi:MAG: 2-C-methyl-D-erythritol 4-phosphate cytidylyltransferase [Ruminococcus sp.]|nr:2-C-methyl-D-erythritol 4-phosphate cytidylyltransferase [Ruminococcus sp.]
MNIGMIFAGGTGTRMNTKSCPKQFLKLYGKEIIIYTLEHFQRHEAIDAIAVVCIEPWIPYLKDLLKKYNLDKVKWVVPGGNSGQESIFNGLKAAYDGTNDDNAIVLIHDGVRPLINGQLISDCIESVKTHGSAITTVPAIETIAIIDKQSNEITGTVNRADCMIARAPQCFYLGEIMENHFKAIAENRFDFIDSASLMKNYGHSLYVVPGPMENIKITTPSDYYTFKAFIERQNDADVFGI